MSDLKRNRELGRALARKGKLTIAVLMQRSDDDAILAERRFKVITDSLR